MSSNQHWIKMMLFILISTFNFVSGNNNLLQRRFPEQTQEESEPCLTPEWKKGACTLLRNCPSALKHVNENKCQHINFLPYIKSRLCRVSDSSVLVCCEDAKSKDITPLSKTNQYSIKRNYDCSFSSVKNTAHGLEITPGSHPWLVAVGNIQNGVFKFSCGGTIITKKHVITASHCFKKELQPLSHILAGAHSFKHQDTRYPTQLIKIFNRKNPIFQHGGIKLDHDLELLILDEEIQFQERIQPVCLPLNLPSSDYVQEHLRVVGWGQKPNSNGKTSDVPNEVQVQVLPQNACKEIYRRTDTTFNNENKFCATGLDGQDSCQGDSGGPLLYTEPFSSKQYLVGVVSFGSECGSFIPGAYTRIISYIDWIDSHL